MKRLAALLFLLTACSAETPVPATPEPPPPIGNAARGKLLAAQYGCNVCHIIPGVEGPQGSLGPSLEGLSSRPTISNGVIPNTPDKLIEYIQQPALLNPETTMPALGVAPPDARDIAAYLLTLK